jgi:hypothetical protein
MPFRAIPCSAEGTKGSAFRTDRGHVIEDLLGQEAAQVGVADLGVLQGVQFDVVLDVFACKGVLVVDDEARVAWRLVHMRIPRAPVAAMASRHFLGRTTNGTSATETSRLEAICR